MDTSIIPDGNEEKMKRLLEERKIPDKNWNISMIEDFLLTLSMMDSNNFTDKASVGEREGRCFSNIVSRRHYYFTHGIGRSGDLTEPQPKAAGSSILYKITNILIGDFMKLKGFLDVTSLLVPLSTNLSLRLSLLLFGAKRKNGTQIWFDDNDIKTLILETGMNPCRIFVQQNFPTDKTDSIICAVLNFKNLIHNMKIITYCKNYNVPIILHNVHFDKKLINEIEAYSKEIDLIIYNDNLSVCPTGSTIISSSDAKILEDFSKTYPGRASISSTIDIFVTLLSLGKDGIQKLTEEHQSVSLKNNSAQILLNNAKPLDDLVPKTFLQKGFDALKSKNKQIDSLVLHGKIPDIGWGENIIEYFLRRLSIFENKGTYHQDCIRRRHYNFVNGLDCVAPKNCETSSRSSVLQDLTGRLLQDLFKIMGVQSKIRCLLLPVATGMSLVLAMLSFKRLKPLGKYVIWSRIDQKSCFKSIVTAGFIPIIVDTRRNGEEYTTDIDQINTKIIEVGAANILCITSTTSCFAPRACDNIETISEICKNHNLFHLVNNAYGVTSKYIMKRIHKAKLKGKLDIFVQSTDKNLNVPVGGAIVGIFKDKEYDQVFDSLEKICLGKMSLTTTLDAFITLLNMGKSLYIKMVEDREMMYLYLKKKLLELAEKHDEEVIENPGNPISVALTLRRIPKDNLTQLGSMLFLRNVFGSRIVTTTDNKTICGYQFNGWGAHSIECNTPYIASAAAFGVCKDDIDIYIKKLDYQLAILKTIPF